VSDSYALPVFPLGTGLGNRLFHWCDTKVFSYRTGARFISPRWTRLAIGASIRKFLRTGVLQPPSIDYCNTFGAVSPDVGYARGIASTFFFDRVHCSLMSFMDERQCEADCLYLFSKSGYTFTPYEPYRARIVDELKLSLRPSLQVEADQISTPHIGIHIRCGDGFKKPELGSDGFIRTGWLQQTPINWFVETLLLFRRHANWDVPAVLFSDGSAHQLEPLLNLPGVYLGRGSSAVVDLFALAKSRLILGSGSSTFSAFAAFLGYSDVLTAPGHPFSNYGLSNSKDQVVASVNPRETPDQSMMSLVLDHLNQVDK